MYKPFGWEVKRALRFAAWEARRLGQRQVGVEHVLLALLESDFGGVRTVLECLGVDIAKTIAQVEHDLNSDVSGAVEELPFTPEVEKAIAGACQETEGMEWPHVQAEHLLLGLLRDPAGAPARMLKTQGVDPEQVRGAFFPLLGGESREGGGLTSAKSMAEQCLMAEVGEVIKAWPELPEALRKRILEVVRSAGPPTSQ